MSQSELNKDMVELGVSRYRRIVQSARQHRKEARTPYGQRLLRNYLPKLVEEAELRIEYHRKNRHSIPFWMPLMWDMDIDEVCYLALKITLDGIGEKRPLGSTANAIAMALEDECRYKQLKDEHPEVFNYIKKTVLEKHGDREHRRQRESFLRHEKLQASKGSIRTWKRWSLKERTSMGAWLLELIRTSTYLIAFRMLGEREKSVMYVVATDELFEWMQEYNKDQEILKPLWLPTVELPEEWSSVWVGGYKDVEGVPPLPFVKTYDYNYLHSLKFGEMKDVVNGVNHVQKTAWEVNDDVLGVAKWAWQNDKEIGEMVRRSDYELPIWNAIYETDDVARKEYSRKCGVIHNLNISMRSRRLAIMKTLWTAEKFESKNKFYFPHQLDFRGRMYPIPFFLSPQGTDLSKSLLRFATPKMITTDADARWLAIHGANCFGKSKLTFDERVEWVESRRKEIIEVHNDPRTNDWWTVAEEPWQFLAFCREWAEYLKVGKGFTTRLPCAMDASNNGIQILSLLGRDEEGARATNVLPTDKPADLYTDISDAVNERLLTDAKAGNHLASTWFKFGIDRKATKAPCMVKPYGGTRYSCRELLSDWYHKKTEANEHDPFLRDTPEALNYLTELVWTSMNKALKKQNRVMTWFRDLVKVMNKDNLPVKWTTPNGLKIVQNYRARTVKRIGTLLGDKVVTLKCREDIVGKVDKARQSNGISPNFVHSLDASVAQKTALYAKASGIDSLAMVHDSFATHSTNCDTLATCIRQATAEIFSTDILSKFRDEVTTQTEKELPELPEYGTLDPNDVIDSEYYFA